VANITSGFRQVTDYCSGSGISYLRVIVCVLLDKFGLVTDIWEEAGCMYARDDNFYFCWA